jgi:ribosomal protein S13
MSSNMNSRSITDYILKLEKENSNLKKERVAITLHEAAEFCDYDFQESRTKIEHLKKLFHEASEEKVKALTELNELKYQNRLTQSFPVTSEERQMFRRWAINKANEDRKEQEAIGKQLDSEIQRVGRVLNESSYTDSTARVCGETPYCKNSANGGIVERLLELGEMTSDFHKTAAYQGAANSIAELEYTVESGESVRHIRGIGRSISAKIDEYLDEYDSDYETSECSDTESIASNDLTEDGSESEYEPDEEVTATQETLSSDDDAVSEASSYDDYRMTFHTNVIIADELANLGALEKCNGSSDWKVKAYTKAARLIDDLPYEVLNGTDLMKLGGIGKGIAEKIDEIIQYGTTRRAHDLKEQNPDTCN